MVKGANIKRAVHKAPIPAQASSIQLIDSSCNPPRLKTEPYRMGNMFSKCLEGLGGDLDVQVNDSRLCDFICNLPRCAREIADDPLPFLSAYRPAHKEPIRQRQQVRTKSITTSYLYFLLS